MISRLRTQAAEKGLDPDVTENLFRVIIRQSRVKQTVSMQYKGVRPGATVLIIGGAGQMGPCLPGCLKIRISGPDPDGIELGSCPPVVPRH